MKDFTIAMALVDYIPVILFAVAAVILQRDLYNKMRKDAFAMFSRYSPLAFCWRVPGCSRCFSLNRKRGLLLWQ